MGLIIKQGGGSGVSSTGLELVLSEGIGTGRRLVGENPDNYGNSGANSIDLSHSLSASATRGATGHTSTIGGGSNNTASGGISVVSGGTGNTASGAESAIGGGTSNTASGIYSNVAGGNLNVASGNRSAVSGGSGNTAYSFGEWVGGLNSTTYSPASTTTFNAADRIFNIGNGTSLGARSDALTIYKNGVILAPSLSTAEIDAAANTVLITKEWFTDNSANFLVSDAASTKTAGSLQFDDAVSLEFGTDNDFELHHSSGFNVIQLNAGDLVIRDGGSSRFIFERTTGDLSVTGELKATNYTLSSLNTAPASATDTGTTGDIRWANDHVYLCIATDTWVRAALATW